MFYHLKMILRSLRRNFTYSSINIAGLAIGITASVLIFMWVYHERSFDTSYPDSKRIYRIINITKYEGNTNINSSLHYPFIQACQDEIPEIESIAVLANWTKINAVTVNNTVFSVENYAYVNRKWLEMFHSQILDGSFDTFDANFLSVVLSESESKKYFGNERAVGQVVSIKNNQINVVDNYTVQAVVKDNPSNSSFRFNAMLSMSDPLFKTTLGQSQWGSEFFRAFVKFRPDANILQVTQKMDNILTKKPITVPNGEVKMNSRLELLTDMHLSDVGGFTRGDAKMVSIFTFAGILLLCTACINYVNLTTARATQRAKEVGIRKIVGANSRTLFLHFINESFIVSLLATIIALCLIWLLTPLFKQLVGDIPVSFSSPTVWIITGITLLFVTVLNGVYPALMLSSFNPVNVLKGISLPKIKDNSLRRILVVFQFTLSATLIICVIVIFMQTRFILNTDPGFRRDNIVRAGIPYRTLLRSENISSIMQTIKGKLQSYPDVVGVALNSAGNIENINVYGGWSGSDWDGRTKAFYPNMYSFTVDEDFMNVYELQLTAGRWFDGVADMQNVILNETAIREYEILEPYIGQRFYTAGKKGNIIGIVKDFNFKSRHEKIAPLAIFQNEQQLYVTLSVKAQKGKTAEVIKAIEAVYKEFFPNDPFEYTFVEDAYNNIYKSDIRTSRLILTFSILAVVIAVLGLFGLSTFAIERRTKEIGIRKVFGASVSSIVRLLTREFLILVGVAFAIAAPLSWWAMSRWLENFAYRINITVWIFVAGAIITLAIAIIAVGGKAVKAATANPVEAIKND